MTWHVNLRAQYGCAEIISANVLKWSTPIGTHISFSRGWLLNVAETVKSIGWRTLKQGVQCGGQLSWLTDQGVYRPYVPLGIRFHYILTHHQNSPKKVFFQQRHNHVEHMSGIQLSVIKSKPNQLLIS